MALKTRNDAEKTLEDQVKDLQNELASITRSMASQGSALLDDARNNASDAYETIRKSGRRAAREVSHQAQVVTDTARENPLATAAVIAGAGLLLLMLSRR